MNKVFKNFLYTLQALGNYKLGMSFTKYHVFGR